MKTNNIIKEIQELKEKRNAVIVAHNYQIDEVQEVADIIGDSLALSKYCADVEKDVIVFCGVHFMAESAKILSPDKTVLLPEMDAGCPMADMVTKEALIEQKKKYPNATVVCYINSSAEVKSECDICCTSSNAVDIVKAVKSKDILFVPDQNLGSYVAKMVPEKNIILWEGYCSTHHRVKIDELQKVKELKPNAKILVHPECQPNIVDASDFAGSTKQIIDYVAHSTQQEFIIGTEMGILFKLKKDNPDKKFYLLSQGLVCPNMKKTSLLSVYRSLADMKYEINLKNTIRLKAKKALDEMLKLS